MIVSCENIRAVRPIAENVIDEKRIKPYIVEAETLDVLPAIGAGLYKQLDEAIVQVNNGTIITNNAGETITIGATDWKDLLRGCYYECDCSCGDKTKRHEGLENAVAYLAYSRLVRNNQINVTAFGVVQKTTQFSEPTDEKTLIRHANEAQKIGLAYLGGVIDYMKCIGIICERKMKSNFKFKSIGD